MKLDKYDFKFGLGFLREINKGAEYNLHGIVVNAGLEKTLPNLMGRDIETLVEVLKIANKTEKPRISDAEIERIIEECDDVTWLTVTRVSAVWPFLLSTTRFLRS